MTAQPDQKDQPDQPEDQPRQPEGQSVVSRRAAFPGAPPSAPSYEEEIDTATQYERSLVGKALLAIAVVVLILAIRAFFSG
jgi:hypothetical protein